MDACLWNFSDGQAHGGCGRCHSAYGAVRERCPLGVGESALGHARGVSGCERARGGDRRELGAFVRVTCACLDQPRCAAARMRSHSSFPEMASHKKTCKLAKKFQEIIQKFVAPCKNFVIFETNLFSFCCRMKMCVVSTKSSLKKRSRKQWSRGSLARHHQDGRRSASQKLCFAREPRNQMNKSINQSFFFIGKNFPTKKCAPVPALRIHSLPIPAIPLPIPHRASLHSPSPIFDHCMNQVFQGYSHDV